MAEERDQIWRNRQADLEALQVIGLVIGLVRVVI